MYKVRSYEPAALNVSGVRMFEIVDREIPATSVVCEDGLVIFRDFDASRMYSSYRDIFAMPLANVLSIEEV
jgi:hypothetical protein